MVAVELAKLLAAFPAQEQSASPVALRMEAYFDALFGIPAWAVEQARLKVIRREVATLNPTFAPTPPEFGEIARNIVAPLRADLNRMEEIAQATANLEPTPEERERIVTGFDNLKAELGPRGNSADQIYDDADRALRKRLRDLGRPETDLDGIANSKP